MMKEPINQAAITIVILAETIRDLKYMKQKLLELSKK